MEIFTIFCFHQLIPGKIRLRLTLLVSLFQTDIDSPISRKEEILDNVHPQTLCNILQPPPEQQNRLSRPKLRDEIFVQHRLRILEQNVALITHKLHNLIVFLKYSPQLQARFLSCELSSSKQHAVIQFNFEYPLHSGQIFTDPTTLSIEMLWDWRQMQNKLKEKTNLSNPKDQNFFDILKNVNGLTDLHYFVRNGSLSLASLIPETVLSGERFFHIPQTKRPVKFFSISTNIPSVHNKKLFSSLPLSNQTQNFVSLFQKNEIHSMMHKCSLSPTVSTTPFFRESSEQTSLDTPSPFKGTGSTTISTKSCSKKRFCHKHHRHHQHDRKSRSLSITSLERVNFKKKKIIFGTQTSLSSSDVNSPFRMFFNSFFFKQKINKITLKTENSWLFSGFH